MIRWLLLAPPESERPLTRREKVIGVLVWIGILAAAAAWWGWR